MKNLNMKLVIVLCLLGPLLLAQEINDPVEADPFEVVSDQSTESENLQNSSEVSDPEVQVAISDQAENEVSTASAVTMIEEEEVELIDRHDIVTISSNSELKRNERAKDMVTIMGSSVSAGRIDGDMVTILGDSELDGFVDGDFVVIMGSANLGPNAEVDGDTVVIGGSLNRHMDSITEGEVVNVPFLGPVFTNHFQKLPLFVQECIFLFRPISPNVTLTFYIAGVFLIFYLLLAALFPKPMERSRRAIEEKPLQSFFSGVLIIALHLPFILLLIVTVVGIFLVPLIDIALLSIAVFGKAVTFLFVGKQITRAVRVSFLDNLLVSILLGGGIVYALYMIPFFGLFLWIVLSILGLGAVSVAIGESISSRKEARRSAPHSPPLAGQNQSNSSSVNPVNSVAPGTSLSQIDSATAMLFPKVGFWWRTMATLIDIILVLLITSVMSLAGTPIPFFIYFIVFWGWKGSTLGGMALGLRVQKISGEPVDWPTAFIRSFSSIVSFLPLCLGFFWAGWDPDNQSWHDKISGTNVVRVPKGYTWN
jgi:uncharacterized RDD family membrane protein YckC